MIRDKIGLDHSGGGRASGIAGQEGRAEGFQRCRKRESGSKSISKIEGRGGP